MKEAILLLVLTLSCSHQAAATCPVETPVFTGSFEMSQGFQLAGDVIGLAGAQVEARVGSGEGRVVAAVTIPRTSSYQLTIPALAPELMIRIVARGIGAEDFIELAGHAGSVGLLQGLASNNSGVVTLKERASLAVTPDSTVRYGMIARQNGGNPDLGHDCRLSELDAGLSRDAVAEAVAWLKIVADEGQIGAATLTQGEPRTGTFTTLDVLVDQIAFQNEIARVEMLWPGRLATVQASVRAPFCGNFQGELRVILRDLENHLIAVQGSHFDFQNVNTGKHTQPDQHGTFIGSCANDEMTFTIDSSGNEFLTTRPISGVMTQVRAIRKTIFHSFRLLDVGINRITVLAGQRDITSFPDHPQLPSEPTEYTSAQLAIAKPGYGTPINPASQPGEYSLHIGGASAVSDTNSVYARVLLNANGTGSLFRDGSPVAWTLLEGRVLSLQLPDRTVEFSPISDDASASYQFSVVSFAGGGRIARSSLAYLRQPGAAFVQSEFPSALTQYGGQAGPNAGYLVFDLRTDGSASAGARMYGWILGSDGRLTLRSCGPATPIFNEPTPGPACSTYERRVFDVFGRRGNFLFIYEERDNYSYSASTGQFTLTVTQRINRPYSISH